MLKKVVLSLAILSFAASAATYKVTLSQPAVVKGQELKPGEYKLNLEDTKVTIVNGKQSLEVPVKVESVDQKFDSTSVRYVGTEKPKITEIRLGGTKTKIIFND
ncbi:MAG TPA: hypothetical protein VMH81_06460 [Bryobacteraceae bacterium]|nr:hypothetical protein [Bryobacteraceae bacterium]HXK02415.1 hypothetical protein [Verrucomicrobiae bacterium]